MSQKSKDNKLPRLQDIMFEQDKSDNGLGYYILDSKHGTTIVSDQTDFRIEKKTFIARGVNLKVLASLTLNAKMINDGKITIGFDVKDLVKMTIDGCVENNNEIQNNGIFIVSKTGSLKQDSGCEFNNNGVFENHGSIENAGYIYNNKFFTNRGLLKTTGKGSLQTPDSGTYNDTFSSAYID